MSPLVRFRLLVVVGLSLGMGVLAAINLGQWLPWKDRIFPGFLVFPQGIVGPLSLSTWTGARSGLDYHDYILSFENHPFDTSEEFYAWVSKLPEGTPVHYKVNRGGIDVWMMIPTDRLTRAEWWGLLLSSWLPAVAGIVFVFLICLARKFDGRGVLALLCFMPLSEFGMGSVEYLTGGMLSTTYLFVCQLIPPSIVAFFYRIPKERRFGAGAKTFIAILYVAGILIFLATQIWLHSPRAYIWVDYGVFSFVAFGALLSLGLVLDAWFNPGSDSVKRQARILLQSTGVSVMVLVISVVVSFMWEIDLLLYGLFLATTLGSAASGYVLIQEVRKPSLKDAIP